MKRWIRNKAFSIALLVGLVGVFLFTVVQAQFETRVRNSDDIDFIGAISVRSDVFTIKDQVDATKKAKFSLSGITTGTTRTITLPDSSGTLATLEALVDPTLTLLSQEYIINSGAKVGTTAGWLVNQANNLSMLGDLPSGSTSATLIVPLSKVHVGDSIVSYHLIGTMLSDAVTSTLDADLRVLRSLGDSTTDNSVGSMTQLAKSSNVAISALNTTKTLTTAEDIGTDETFYLKITGTTASAKTIALQGIAIVVNEAY